MALRSLRIGGMYLQWRNEQIATLLRSKDGEVARDVQRRAYAVQKRMKRLAPYRYGTLRRGIKVESVRESPDGPYSSVISTAPHTNLAESGRGPVSAEEQTGTLYEGEYRPALKFQPRRGTRSIFRYGPVAAMKGTKFMERSVDAALD